MSKGYLFIAIFLLLVSSVSALPVTYEGSLLINGASGVDVNVTLVSSTESVTGLFNDSYVLNLVGVEGSEVDLFVEGELYSSLTQPSMASLVSENIYWPLQTDGNPCNVDQQCVSSVCCSSSSANNYHQCGVCSFPVVESSGSNGDSGSIGGLYVPPVTEPVVDDSGVINASDLVVDDSSEESFNDSNSEKLFEEIDEQPLDSESFFNKLYSVVSEWVKNNSVLLINILVSLLLVSFYLLYLRYRREDEDDEDIEKYSLENNNIYK